jgi:hypothetical protein
MFLLRGLLLSICVITLMCMIVTHKNNLGKPLIVTSVLTILVFALTRNMI